MSIILIISRPIARSGLGGGVLFGSKWTFSNTFWEQVVFCGFFSDIVDLSAYFLRESGLFRAVTAGPKGMDKDTF